MTHKSLLLILPLLLLSTGCGMFESPPQPKAVVKAPSKKAVAQAAQPTVKKPAVVTPGPTTFAIDNSPGNFKDEANVPAFHDQAITAPAELQSQPQPQTQPQSAAGTVATPPADNSSGMISANTTPAGSAANAAAMPVAIKLEDASIPAGTSPAVVALVSESDRNRNKGDLNSAVVDMERALRIDSRNPTITYKLAQLRFKQSKLQQAEELAGKAALLAGGNLDLKRKSWLLIAEARKVQHNYQGAKDAKAKAESFFGR